MQFVKNALIFLFEKILDIIYPKQCIICGKLDEDIICDKCFNEKVYSKMKKETKIVKYIEKNFEEHLYVFKYEGEIRNFILEYKFKDKAYLSEFFVKIMLKNEKICRILKKYDIIIPVPIHKKRKAKRGYNQSEIIVNKLAKKITEIQVYNDVLMKYRNTKKQSELTKIERFENVKNVYKIQNIEKIKNKRVVLFDDIYTTGATCNECARILKENGAKEILVLTIAKD